MKLTNLFCKPDPVQWTPDEIIKHIREHRNLNGEPTRFTYLRRLVRTRPFVKTVMP